MTKPGFPPRFKILTAPMAVSIQKINKSGNYRGSPRDRGYDAKWDRLSVAYRRKHPVCAWCEQQGRDTVVDLVDHMIPVVDRPDLKYSWANLWALCSFHHGRKAAMEIYARDQGLLDMLPVWCREPSKRPAQFRPIGE